VRRARQGNRLFLVGGETVRVPFKFLSLDPAAHISPAFQVKPLDISFRKLIYKSLRCHPCAEQAT
jgi:hypothetical protein